MTAAGNTLDKSKAFSLGTKPVVGETLLCCHIRLGADHDTKSWCQCETVTINFSDERRLFAVSFLNMD